MVWLLNSQWMKNCKSTEWFCRSILAIYTNDWSTFWYVYCCYVYFFSGKFLNMCKPRTTTCSLWQPGPPGLAFYGSGSACLTSWVGMVSAGWLCSMRSETSCKWNLSFFKAVSPNLGSLFHIISSLFSNFRSWDYPEHFQIYSQLSRKSNLVFHFPQCVYFLNWTEQNPNLIAFTSKIQVFCRPEWIKGWPHENEFWQFLNAKMTFVNS